MNQVVIDTSPAAVQVISLFVGVFLPLLVGLVTKKVTSSGKKAVLLALLSALSGFGAEWLAGPDHFNVTAALLTWVQTFVVAVASHYGLLKPTGVSERAQSTLVK